MTVSKKTAHWMNEAIKVFLLGACAYLGITGFVEIAQTIEYTPLTPVQKIIAGLFCAIAYRIVANKDLIRPDEEEK